MFKRGLFFVLLLAGCNPVMRPGNIGWKSDDPIVVIEAGNLESSGQRFAVRYVIDQATQTCWFTVASDVAPMSCCKLARLKSAAEFVKWDTSAECSARP
jgi:hypothetical protein